MATSVTVEPDTVHTRGVVDAYVIVPPAVEVASRAGAVAPYTVFANAGNVIVFTPAPIVKLCVTCVAAA